MTLATLIALFLLNELIAALSANNPDTFKGSGSFPRDPTVVKDEAM